MNLLLVFLLASVVTFLSCGTDSFLTFVALLIKSIKGPWSLTEIRASALLARASAELARETALGADKVMSYAQIYVSIVLLVMMLVVRVGVSRKRLRPSTKGNNACKHSHKLLHVNNHLQQVLENTHLPQKQHLVIYIYIIPYLKSHTYMYYNYYNYRCKHLVFPKLLPK